MEYDLTLSEMQTRWHGTLKSYWIGFIFCVLLTITSFVLVSFNLLSGYTLVGTLISLALVQAIIQSLFFLHVGQEGKPYWETIFFGLMLFILAIVVFGTLWIMYDLDQRVMADMNMEQPMEHHHD